MACIFHVYNIEVIAADITLEDTINIIHHNNQQGLMRLQSM